MSPILRPVNFKEVWTTNVRMLYINPYWSTKQFLLHIKRDILCAFNIDSSYDIIVTGQELEENAPALRGESITLREKWGDNLDVSFYIRRMPFVHTTSTQENITDECPICLDTLLLISRNGCSHRFCVDCIEHCQQVGYTICPLCRQT